MDSDYMTGASDLLVDIADLLSGLNLTDLPPLGNLHLDYSGVKATWKVSAQVRYLGNESDAIDAVRAWAAALDAEIRLDKPFKAGSGSSFRTLKAVAELEFGASFQVWTHVAETTPDELTAA